MFTIQPKTVEVKHLVIELDEEQARAILVDATDFQKQLRSHLANGHTRKVRVGQPTLRTKKKGRKQIPKVQCPGCDRAISIGTIFKHIQAAYPARAAEYIDSVRAARS